MSNEYDAYVDFAEPDGDDTHFAEQQYVDEPAFSELEVPNTSSDSDGDGFGYGVDANEFTTVEEQLMPEVEANAYGIDEAVDEYLETQGLENALENTACWLAVEETGLDSVPYAEEACSGLLQDDEDRAAKELYENRVECSLLEADIFDADTEDDQEQAIEAFQEQDCNYKIEHVDHETLYEECINEPTIEDARECVEAATGIDSLELGDSNGNGIPNSLDADVQDVSVEYDGDASGMTESGDVAFDQYYDVAGNDYYSNEVAEHAPPTAEPAFCESEDVEHYYDQSDTEYGSLGDYGEEPIENGEMSMYDQQQRYTAESDAFMAQHTDDPITAAEYAEQAEHSLHAISSGVPPAEVEHQVHDALHVAQELDYSYERSNIVFDEHSEEEYGLDDDSPCGLDSYDSNSSDVESSDYYSSADSSDSFDSGSIDDGTFGSDGYDSADLSGGASDSGDDSY